MVSMHNEPFSGATFNNIVDSLLNCLSILHISDQNWRVFEERENYNI